MNFLPPQKREMKSHTCFFLTHKKITKQWPTIVDVYFWKRESHQQTNVLECTIPEHSPFGHLRQTPTIDHHNVSVPSFHLKITLNIPCELRNPLRYCQDIKLVLHQSSGQPRKTNYPTPPPLSTTPPSAVHVRLGTPLAAASQQKKMWEAGEKEDVMVTPFQERLMISVVLWQLHDDATMMMIIIVAILISIVIN